MGISFKPVINDRVERYPLAASQTIAVGDPVFANANGLVEVAVAGADQALLGIAATSCTSSTAQDPILVFNDPKAQFIGNCDNSAQNLQAEVGDTCDFAGTTGSFTLNLDAATNPVARVLGVVSWEDPLMDGSSFPFQNAAKLRFEISNHQLSS